MIPAELSALILRVERLERIIECLHAMENCQYAIELVALESELQAALDVIAEKLGLW